MTKQEQARVAVVTGASSGIGKAAAKALAAQGWRVIGLGRDAERCKTAAAEIRAAAAPGATADMIRADLASMADTVRAANEVMSLTDRIDALLNNAGGVAKEKLVTAEGLEASFAGNHLGAFLFTRQLLPLVRAAAAQRPKARIVAVSSRAHELSPGINWDDIQHLQNFVAVPAYASAKLGNILFTRALARRVAGEGIVAHTMHPGIVGSNFFTHGDANMQSYAATQKDTMIAPEEAAKTLVWLAAAEEPGQSSGGYYHQCAPAPCSAAAQDDTAAERLWMESEALLARLGV